ncbi:MAG: type IV secretion system DNA-binding domain-containing protein [Planctomycetota bacterium]
MRTVLLGTDSFGHPVRIPKSAFSTHFHLIGGTGKGKTTALHTMLQSLLNDPLAKDCFIIVDRLGNFSQELLLWFASKQFCPQFVRDRLLYICPAREDRVLTFNPLLYDTEAHGYYKVERATEIILRAWESVNIEAMPRLARWTFNSFWAAAQLGLTISDCNHFLMPGSDYHKALLACLPPRLAAGGRRCCPPDRGSDPHPRLVAQLASSPVRARSPTDVRRPIVDSTSGGWMREGASSCWTSLHAGDWARSSPTRSAAC